MHKLCSQTTFKSELDELKLLFEYCDVMGVLDKVYYMDGWMDRWVNKLIDK